MDATFPALLRGLGAGGKGLTPEMAKQAQQMWKMLDTMSENPQEYKQFIAQQMKQAKDEGFDLANPVAAASSKPVMVLQAAVQPPSRGGWGATTKGKGDAGVSISNIVLQPAQDNDAPYTAAVVSLFEMPGIEAPMVKLKVPWKPASGLAALQRITVPFKVRQACVLIVHISSYRSTCACGARTHHNTKLLSHAILCPPAMTVCLAVTCIWLQAKQPPFTVASTSGPRSSLETTAQPARRVFELGVHPDVLRAACRNEPQDARECLIEHACRHVEREHEVSLSRYSRHLKVRRPSTHRHIVS